MVYINVYCLHQPKAYGGDSVLHLVRVCVSESVSQCVCQIVCDHVISGTTGPIAAKLGTHTPLMGTMNL